MGPEERRRGPAWSRHGPLIPVIVLARGRDQGSEWNRQAVGPHSDPQLSPNTHLTSRDSARPCPSAHPPGNQAFRLAQAPPFPGTYSPLGSASRESQPTPVSNRELHQRPRPHHRPRLPRPSPALTKQMPAARRGTSVHTLCSRHRKVTTVTFSSCSTRGVGARVPRRPQPMARHWVPWDSDWPCWGREASATFLPKEAGRFSCRKEDVRPLPHPPP